MANVWHKFLCALIQPLQRMPLGFHYACCRAVSGAMRLIRYRQDVVTANLARSFPDKKYGELKKISKDFYRHLGEVAAETMWIGGRHREKGKAKVRRRGIITLEGTEELYRAYEKGSVMVLNSHCGNWELMGAYLGLTACGEGSTFTEAAVTVVYRRLHGKFSEFFFHRNRTSLQAKDFDGYVESRVVMRHIIRHLKDKKVYVFPNDQYPYGTALARLEVPFLSQKTEAMTGAGEVAERFKMSVFYMNADRTAHGHYTVRYTKICDDASTMGTEAIIRQYYSMLEQDINNNPSNYLWSHKRWK